MSVVYRANDPKLKRQVALKLIAPELATDERFRQRFLRESELAASLEALERARGATLTDALARVELDSPAGRVRLDANRQAIAPSYVSRLATDADGEPRTLGVLPDVEQTFGGYFKPGDPPTSRTTPACRKGDPPPWAR